MTTEPIGELPVTTLVPGDAQGLALVLREPLSLWGGLDPTGGTVIDRNHPNHGAVITDTVLFLPSGRGSSSASSVLVEMVRLGTSPTAIVLADVDEIIALGVIVARELYHTAPPLALLPRPDFDVITTGMHIDISGTALSYH